MCTLCLQAGEICSYYRTKDILNGPYEEIPGSFDFWDPNLFCDDDGRIYFYWGCSNATPLWGVELDAETMLPLGERKVLIEGDAWSKGYERVGKTIANIPKVKQRLTQRWKDFSGDRNREPKNGFPKNIFL